MSDYNDNVSRHDTICKQLNQLYAKKNHDYGDSFHQTYLEEGLAMARIRLSDKLRRFKTLSMTQSQEVTDESMIDTLLDLANYSIMTIMELEGAEHDKQLTFGDIPDFASSYCCPL